MTQQPAAHHILTFAQTLAGGGVERAMLRLAGAWLARGRRVTLVLGTRDGPLASELPDGIKIVDCRDARYATLARAVPVAVRHARPDVIFCPGNHYSGIAAWARLRLGRDCPPLVAKISNALERHDQRAPVRQGYRTWLRWHPRFIDAIVAMTPGMADEAMRTMGIARERVHVVANPPALPNGTATADVPEGRYLIGVGRLAPQKRWDRAFTALASIADRTIPLILLGEGEDRTALTHFAASLGIAPRVSFRGHVADPLPWIAGATALILTSDYEGVPGVLREALSVGTPVITTDSSVAIREIVTPPDQGTIVARDDMEALVAALDHWLAPGRPRPAPRLPSGDPAGDYLALFDQLVDCASRF